MQAYCGESCATCDSPNKAGSRTAVIRWTRTCSNRHDPPVGARSWTVDIGPLRTSRDFRILTVTQTVSMFGAFITYVAVPLQVARITNSPFQVGLLGLCELAPLLVTALIGGALADWLDRRTLVLAGE